MDRFQEALRDCLERIQVASENFVKALLAEKPSIIRPLYRLSLFQAVSVASWLYKCCDIG